MTPSLDIFNLSFSLEMQTVVWIVFFIVLGIFIVYSIILLYHWFKYVLSSLTMWPFMVGYFGVSSILIGVLFLSAVALS